MPRDKDEDYMLIRDVPKFIMEETNGISVSLASVYNWTRGEARDYMGKKLTLKTIRRIGIRYTTKRWVREFMEQK